MEVSSVELRANIMDWDEGDVHAWLSQLGLPQYENQIRVHRVSGEVLCLMDAESLKEVGIETIGQRLAILKAVYQLKLAQQVPIDPDHYVPPSEVEERQEHLNVDRLYDLIRDQGDRLKGLEEENRRLHDTVQACWEDIHSLRSSQSSRPPNEAESPVNRAPSFKWASFVKSSRSPTKASTHETIIETPQSSPQRAEHDVNTGSSRTPYTPASEKPRPLPSHTPSQPSSGNASASASTSSLNPPPKPMRQDSSDNLKSFKVSLDDPAWKVLPAALKKYKINNDDWQNYAMFICYGSPGNRIERCLSYDEKPLLLFQKLKDAKKNPVFMLKHIKDIRSPIAVAQQKQAARKASSDISSAKSPLATGASASSQGNASHQSRGSHDRIHPPKLQVNHLANLAPQPMTSGANPQSGWPEIMSPAVERQDPANDFTSTVDSSKTNSTFSSATGTTDATDSTAATSAREIPPSTGVSYAVAIYPYMAEQEDEFDVVVGDTFIIVSRARGWWVVQRDPAGSGQVEPDPTKQGWVPAGCLLETSVPVATAISEATSKGGAPAAQPGSTPILPLSILSTSFPGIALMDYKKKGEEELDLAKDDTLRVFKRYNHWSYAVKEESGERGWVPSWFIGKVPSGGAPATPSTSGAPHHFNSATLSLDGDSRFAGDSSASQQAQVSPMSSAFPPLQSRSAAVI